MGASCEIQQGLVGTVVIAYCLTMPGKYGLQFGQRMKFRVKNRNLNSHFWVCSLGFRAFGYVVWISMPSIASETHKYMFNASTLLNPINTVPSTYA